MEPRDLVESLRGDLDVVEQEAAQAALDAARADSGRVGDMLEGSGVPVALAASVTPSPGGGYVLRMESSYPRLALMVDRMVARSKGEAVDDG